MSTVCGSECIVYEYVTQGSQFFAELLTVFGLFCTITGVLQKNYISVFHSLNSCFCVRSYNLRICCKFNFLSEKLRKANCNRCKRKLWFWFSFRFSKMRAENYFSAVSDQFFDRRKSSYQTVLICDFSIDQRNVEVASYKDSFSFYVDIIYGFFV